MRLSQVLASRPSSSLFTSRRCPSNTNLLGNRVSEFWRPTVRYPVGRTFDSKPTNPSLPVTATTTASSDFGSDVLQLEEPPGKWEAWEEDIEKVIYRCRFLTFFGVLGSLIGSFLCFVKGCTYIYAGFVDYFVCHGRSILTLVEAIDVYLLGTVMLVLGMGLYELFISNLDIATTPDKRSNLFGLFPLKERPQWLEVKTLNELKTKLGHVIVMVLLVGMLEKSRTVEIITTGDLLCYSASIILSAGSLYLLSKLTK